MELPQQIEVQNAPKSSKREASLTRFEEYQMLLDIITMAGSLNVRSNVADCIFELRDKVQLLQKNSWDSKRKSFLVHLDGYLDRDFFEESTDQL